VEAVATENARAAADGQGSSLESWEVHIGSLKNGANKAGRASASGLGKGMGLDGAGLRVKVQRRSKGRSLSGELPNVKQGAKWLCIPGGLGVQAGMDRSGLCPPLPRKVDSGQQHGTNCSSLAKGARQEQRACRVQV